jgi:hypothetical protein
MIAGMKVAKSTRLILYEDIIFQLVFVMDADNGHVLG